MRKHSEWMTQSDERILEFIDEHGNHPPKAIRDSLAELSSGMEYHPNYIQVRCRTLQDHGFLQNVGGGTYSITEVGREFLAGEIDAATIAES